MSAEDLVHGVAEFDGVLREECRCGLVTRRPEFNTAKRVRLDVHLRHTKIGRGSIGHLVVEEAGEIRSHLIEQGRADDAVPFCGERAVMGFEGEIANGSAVHAAICAEAVEPGDVGADRERVVATLEIDAAVVLVAFALCGHR